MSSDPFAPPATDDGSHRPNIDLGPALFTLEAQKGGKWKAAFYQDHVEVAHVEDGRRHVIRREELPDQGGVLLLPFGGVMFTINKPEKANILVDPTLVPLLREWIDPILGELIQRPAKQALVKSALFTAFCILMYFVDTTSFWIVLACWKLMAIAAAFAPPTRYLYLVSTIFSAAIVVYFAYWSRADGQWWYWFFAALVAFGGLSSFQRFRFYATPRA